GLEGDQVELSIRRDQQMARVACQGTQRLQHAFVHGTSQLSNLFFFAQWIAKRQAQRIHGLINPTRLSQLLPANFALMANNISHVMWILIGCRIVWKFWIEGAIDSELDQSRVFGDRRLDL